jgi:formylmethanofuran dehydrogenase subunit E
MVLHADDRVQVTMPAAPADTPRELSYVPEGMDLILLETHTPESFPTLLSNQLQPAEGEEVIGRFELYGNVEAAAAAMPIITALMPGDARFDSFLRLALALHGGHGCAGLVLGTRLAMAGVDALGLDAPDRDKRLSVVSETDRCALDGIQAVTGCRLSKRSLRLLDYGKVAATFIDGWTGAAVWVSVRGDLRDRVGEGADADDRHTLQRQAYGTWPAEELFEVRPSAMALSEFEKPGRPHRRVVCAACGEEVSDGREISTESGVWCRPCAAALENGGMA